MSSPLQDLRVLDIGAFMAAPFCATLLGEFGADVVKVEMPDGGDPLRNYGTKTTANDTYMWLSEARNKRSIALDLRTKEDAAIFLDLVENADVICENFRPGTLEKWGLGYDVLSERNPGIILMRVSAYGQTGPYRTRTAFGRVASGFGGLTYLAGYSDRPPVTPGSQALPDYMAGLYGAFGVMMALRERERTKLGQVIDIGLYEPVFRFMDELAPAYKATGKVRERNGPSGEGAVPHSHFPTFDGKWVAVAVTSDRLFERLATMIGVPETAGEGRFGTIEKRLQNVTEIENLVENWTRTLTQQDVLQACESAGVPSGPIYSVSDIFEDPQYAARENIVAVDDPRVGTVYVPAAVPRLSRCKAEIKTLGPALDADRKAILSEWSTR